MPSKSYCSNDCWSVSWAGISVVAGVGTVVAECLLDPW